MALVAVPGFWGVVYLAGRASLEPGVVNLVMGVDGAISRGPGVEGGTNLEPGVEVGIILELGVEVGTILELGVEGGTILELGVEGGTILELGVEEAAGSLLVRVVRCCWFCLDLLGVPPRVPWLPGRPKALPENKNWLRSFCHDLGFFLLFRCV